MELHESNFQIDSLGDEEFAGFSVGDSWNGFACPYFTYEQAQVIVRAFHRNGWHAVYDIEADQFEFSNAGNISDIEVYQGILIGQDKVYPVGAYCWIWSEVVLAKP